MKRKQNRRNINKVGNSAFLVLVLSIFFISSLVFVDDSAFVTPNDMPEVDPPTAESVRVTAWGYTSVVPTDFVSDVTGVEVVVAYGGYRPFSLRQGESDVTIVLEDVAGNITHITSKLSVYQPIELTLIEVGEDLSVFTASDFIDGEIRAGDAERFKVVSNLRDIDVSTVGIHEIDLLLDGVFPPQSIKIEVRDVIPPQGTSVHLELVSAANYQPEDFVTDIVDQTTVTVSYYEEEPDRTSTDLQHVRVLLTDESGNTAVITSTLLLTIDTEPPEITGNFHKTVVSGETVLYRDGITVTDNSGEDITLEVDSSAVVLSEPGVYPVIYSATDISGNETVVEGSLTILSVTADEINTMIDEILERIIKPDMTLRQKARAIFDYSRFRIVYGTNKIRGNVPYAAYMGLRSGVGDCYSSYALTEMLLTRADIENIAIERIAEFPTMHYWSLVNLGDGWYHFDTTQMTGSDRGFMFTESQAQRVTSWMPVEGYYVYDPTLYPEVVQ